MMGSDSVKNDKSKQEQLQNQIQLNESDSIEEEATSDVVVSPPGTPTEKPKRKVSFTLRAAKSAGSAELSNNTIVNPNHTRTWKFRSNSGTFRNPEDLKNFYQNYV